MTITDGRQLVGNLLAFDKHMNVVLSDTEEYRRIKGKHGEPEKEQKRMLGMLLLRGNEVVNLTAEAPPPAQTRIPVDPKGAMINTAVSSPVPAGLAPPPSLKAPPPPYKPSKA